MKYGWHKLAGYEIYVKSNLVMCGIMGKGKQRYVAYPHRMRFEGVTKCITQRRIGVGWIKCIGITAKAFECGARRGTIELR